ncbi:MAG: NAD-dependent epimerase/dehydratase family protein [Verrucomicrobia bacterium]|nr:NAD-dependent epimerase/dehydratase family protein [Cytophagales bacterium]
MTDKILIIGACGQLGTELFESLCQIYGENQVIASDISDKKSEIFTYFEELDVLDTQQLSKIIDEHKITQIYHLAAVLSATGEKNPKFAWQLNVQGLLNVLDAALEKKLQKVFFPSTIAVFGPNTPKNNTPQYTIMDPNTVYGISKQAGERWCEYYFEKYGLDVRSLRYPGLISYKTPPGGGTTDYAVDIFYKALENQSYTCFLSENTYLPMMYMPDGVRATIELMEAPAAKISVRSAYNLSAMSFSPKEIAEAISKHIPDFDMQYEPDFRQQIADSWASSIDDSVAKQDWGWQPHYDLEKMTEVMLTNLRKKLLAEV